MAKLRNDLAKMIIMNYFDDFQFLGAGCFLDQRYDRTFDQNWPDLFSLQFLVCGVMEYGRDGRPPVLLQGPVLYEVTPEHRYWLRGVDGSDLRHLILFWGERGRRLMDTGFLPLMPEGYLAVARPLELEACFRGIQATRKQLTPGAHADAVLLVERMLALLLAGVPRPTTPFSDELQEAASRLRNVAGELSLQNLARDIGMSYSHFRRLFRQQFGVSPHAWRLRCRMEQAAEELLDQSAPVKEVAARAGYEDPAQFSRAFHRQMGLSPSVYRMIGRPTTG